MLQLAENWEMRVDDLLHQKRFRDACRSVPAPSSDATARVYIAARALVLRRFRNELLTCDARWVTCQNCGEDDIRLMPNLDPCEFCGSLELEVAGRGPLSKRLRASANVPVRLAAGHKPRDRRRRRRRVLSSGANVGPVHPVRNAGKRHQRDRASVLVPSSFRGAHAQPHDPQFQRMAGVMCTRDHEG